MPWAPPAQGPFVDWAAPAPLDDVDPYLVWAAATDFADYGGVPVGQVPALVELHVGSTGADLRAAGGTEVSVPAAYVHSRLCAVTIGAGFLARVRTHAPLHAIVRRVELGMPVTPGGQALAPPGAPSPPPPPSPPGRCVLGVIDDGCAFAHAGLRVWDAGRWRTRVASIWDQDAASSAFGPAAAPPEFGYGREASAAALDAWMQAATRGTALDEDSCYRRAGYEPVLRRGATHGMHVLDVACGPTAPAARLAPGRRPSRGPASDCDIVFVQLPRTALRDPTGGWLAAQVVDGIRYVLARAPAGATRVVVNVSYGSRVGPHDGTATLEAAMLELLHAHPTLHLVLPAGNFFDDRAQARLDLAVDEPRSLECFVPPGSELPVFVEVWLPAGADPASLSLVVTPPGRPHGGSPPVAVGQCVVWPASAAPTCTVVYPRRSALGTLGTCVLVVIGSTAQRGGGRPCAPAGRWGLTFNAKAAMSLRAYVARSDADFGMPQRGGRPWFVPDAGYDPRRHLRAARDDLGASAVLRRGALAWTAVHERLHVVGGYRARTLWPAPSPEQCHPTYASAGPTATGGGVPSLALPSDESVVLRGIRAAGTRGAATLRLVGTSTAAPQWARHLVGAGAPAATPPPGPPGQAASFFGAGLVAPP